MTERESILEGLKPLFKEAREKGLWFYCEYQDIWISPDGLEYSQSEGNCIWEAAEWTLRHPNERKEQLRREAESAAIRLKAFEAMHCTS